MCFGENFCFTRTNAGAPFLTIPQNSFLSCISGCIFKNVSWVFLYLVLKIMKSQLFSGFEGKKKKIWEVKLTIFKIIPMRFLPKHQMLLGKKLSATICCLGTVPDSFKRDKESDAENEVNGNPTPNKQCFLYKKVFQLRLL